jgi:hypothetical protein
MKRYQHRRGIRLPDGVRLVARPTRWGNPFKVGVHGNVAACVAQYRVWLVDRLAANPDFLAPLQGAAGLACYCDLGAPCHVDVLVEALVA